VLLARALKQSKGAEGSPGSERLRLRAGKLYGVPILQVVQGA
jgi:hypothetical protein